MKTDSDLIVENQKIKPQRVFNDVIDKKDPASIKAPLSAKQYEAKEAVTWLDDDTKMDEVAPEYSIKPETSKSWSFLAKLSIFAIFSLALVQAGLWLWNTWHENTWLFGFYTAVLSIISLWFLRMLFRERRKLKRLKWAAEQQQVGERLLESMQMGEAKNFINNIINHLPPTNATKKFEKLLSEEQNDAEQLALFDSTVLNERDQIGLKIVRRYAAESALLLAASPLAVLDMALILWRNQKLIKDIAACYGIELGYWSRVKLIRTIIVNIIYAGTTEMALDLGTQLMSVEMSGKFSARLGQGLGGGLLTARLGYQAMALCRPLPFTAKTKPKLSRIHKELLIELKDFSSVVAKKGAATASSMTGFSKTGSAKYTP